jgi:hypothetical protein
MSQAVQKERWNHTAELIAKTWELHRDAKKRSQPFTIEDFHPYLRRRRPSAPYTCGMLRAEADRYYAAQAKQVKQP